jgi:hypothetical protein
VCVRVCVCVCVCYVRAVTSSELSTSYLYTDLHFYGLRVAL